MASAKMGRTSRKRNIAHTVDEFKAILSGLAADPSKRPRTRRRTRPYATPCDDTDVFDMLPTEMVREVLMRVERWRDVVAFQATARRFVDVLAPCDTWTRKYAPTTPYDLTVSVRTSSSDTAPHAEAGQRGDQGGAHTKDDEPLEAFVAVHERWGTRAKGFDSKGLCRLAAAGRTEALLWLDGVVYQKRFDVEVAVHGPDALGHSYINRISFEDRLKYARAAAAAGRADTLAAIFTAHSALTLTGAQIMMSAVESNCAATVDVVHAFARTRDGFHRPHLWCHNGLVLSLSPPSPLSSDAPLTVLDHLHAIGCPSAVTPAPTTMGVAISKGLLRVVTWLDAHPDVQAQPRQLRRCSRSQMDNAAADGHFAVVRWVHENGVRRCALSTLVAGVRSGRPGLLDFCRWALADDPSRPLSCTYGRCTAPAGARACRRPPRVPEWRDGLLAVEAAKAGALDVVRWLYETYPDTVTAEAARAAASACNADIAVYLHEVRVAPLTTYRALRRAAGRAGQRERHGRGCVTDTRVGDTLEKLAVAGAPYDAKVLAEVVRHRCTPALQAVVTHYCVPAPDVAAADERVSNLSSSSGLEPPSIYVKRPSPRPTPDDVMRAAVAADRLDMIRWVRDNVKGARLCVAAEAMRAAGCKANRIAALGRCRCGACKARGR